MGVPGPFKEITEAKTRLGRALTHPGDQCNRPGVLNVAGQQCVVRRVPS